MIITNETETCPSFKCFLNFMCVCVCLISTEKKFEENKYSHSIENE